MTAAYLLSALDPSDEAGRAFAREYARRRAATQEPHPLDDAAVLARVRTGDESAFALLFDRYARSLTVVAIAIVSEPDMADDVVQSVMLRLWRHRETLEVKKDLAGYLRSAVYNEAKNILVHHARTRRRAERAMSLGDHREAALAPDDMVAQQEFADFVRHAIDALPERAGDVFRLWLYADLSYAEIASMLGISVKGVEQGRARALAQLRQTLLPRLRAEVERRGSQDRDPA